MTSTPETVVAAVGVRAAPDWGRVLETLCRGVDELVSRAVGIELSWSTTVVVHGDDLESGRARLTTDGLDWERVAARFAAGDPESVTLTAQSTEMREAYLADPDPERYDPRMYVAEVRATFPTRIPGGAEPSGGLRVRTTMSRWALFGGGDRLDWLAGPLRGWLAYGAETIGADTGYVAVEESSPTDDRSPVERERDLLASHRDFPRWLWGVGWGTLLGPGHVAAIGGPASLEAVEGTVYQVPGGRWWIELGPDPGAVREQQATALLAALAPALRDADDPTADGA